MAHFAELDKNNIVTAIHVVANDELLENGVEVEQKGKQFLWNHFNNFEMNLVQTSYNHSFRKRYAAIGFIYDYVRDAFIAPKKYESFIFDEETCSWIPPKPKPEPVNDGVWIWDELTKDWFKLVKPSA